MRAPAASSKESILLKPEEVKWICTRADSTITLKYDKECKEFYADDPVSVKLLQGIIANHRFSKSLYEKVRAAIFQREYTLGMDFEFEEVWPEGQEEEASVYNTVIISHMLLTYLRGFFWHFTNVTQRSEPQLNSIAQSKIRLAWLLSFIPCYSGWQFFE